MKRMAKSKTAETISRNYRAPHRRPRINGSLPQPPKNYPRTPEVQLLPSQAPALLPLLPLANLPLQSQLLRYRSHPRRAARSSTSLLQLPLVATVFQTDRAFLTDQMCLSRACPPIALATSSGRTTGGSHWPQGSQWRPGNPITGTRGKSGKFANPTPETCVNHANPATRGIIAPPMALVPRGQTDRRDLSDKAGPRGLIGRKNTQGLQIDGLRREP